jgi:hypothetical protein
MPDLIGRFRQVRHSGFISKTAACRARDKLQAQTPQLRAGASWTHLAPSVPNVIGSTLSGT